MQKLKSGFQQFQLFDSPIYLQMLPPEALKHQNHILSINEEHILFQQQKYIWLSESFVVSNVSYKKPKSLFLDLESM